VAGPDFTLRFLAQRNSGITAKRDTAIPRYVTGQVE
jgi:hypothetical protein